MQLFMVLALMGCVLIAIVLRFALGNEDWAYRAIIGLLFVVLGKFIWDFYERWKRKRDISGIVLAEINNFRDHTTANLDVLKSALDQNQILDRYRIEKLKYLTDSPITIKNADLNILPRNLMAEIMRMNVRFRNIDIEIQNFWILQKKKNIPRIQKNFQEMLAIKCIYLWVKCTSLILSLESYQQHLDFPADQTFDDYPFYALSLKALTALKKTRQDPQALAAALREVPAGDNPADPEQIVAYIDRICEKIGNCAVVTAALDSYESVILEKGWPEVRIS